MSCPFDKELLTGFFDGELDGAEKAQVESHISSCSECLRDLGEIKSAAILVRELPRARAPRSIAVGVSREIATSGRVHSMARFRGGLFWATGAAAALLIVLNVAYFLPQWSGSEEPAADSVALAPGPRTAEKAAASEAESKAALRDQRNVLEVQQRQIRELQESVERTREKMKKAPESGDRLAVAKDEKRLGRDKAPTKPSEPAPEPAPAPKPLAAKGGARPAPAAPPPAPARPKLEAKRAAAPADDAGKPVVGKAALAKAPEKKADEAVRPNNAKEADLGQRRDGKSTTAVKQYLVSAADVAAVRRSIESSLRGWGVAPARNESEKELLGAKFRKLQTADPTAPMELQLTDAQLAALTKRLQALKEVELADYQPVAQQQRGALASRRSASVAKQKVGEGKPAAERNRAVQPQAEEAAKAPGAAAAVRPVHRRVIFHFRTAPRATLKKEK